VVKLLFLQDWASFARNNLEVIFLLNLRLLANRPSKFLIGFYDLPSLIEKL
jgi:hypothetical protein